MTLSHDEKFCVRLLRHVRWQADFCFVPDNADAINIDIAFTYAMTDLHWHER